MAGVNGTFPSILDVAKTIDPQGKPAAAIEMLAQNNPLLAESVWKEGNLPTGHRYTARTALPSVTWRRMNEGVNFGKAKNDQVDETCGQMAAMGAVDKETLKLYGAGGAAYRLNQQKGFLQAFNNELETGFFYHSIKTNPEKIQGLAPRLDATTNPWGSQILKLDGSASGNDQTSIWLIGWGLDTVFAMYPKGSSAGIEHTDMGEQLVDDGTGKKFVGMVDSWAWKCGLCVEDARYLVRIANVDTGNLTSANLTLIYGMVDATYMVQDLRNARFAFYCNRTVARFLHKQAIAGTTQSTLAIEKIGGEAVTTLLGIPIRRTDALLNTEAPIS
jgi:hypothetical protein